MCLEWGRKRGRPARSSLFAMFQGEKLVRQQEIATFPVLRRVGNTDDGKTNVQFLGRAAHLKLDQLTDRSDCTLELLQLVFKKFKDSCRGVV